MDSIVIFKMILLKTLIKSPFPSIMYSCENKLILYNEWKITVLIGTCTLYIGKCNRSCYKKIEEDMKPYIMGISVTSEKLIII